MSNFLTVNDVAARYHITPQTIRRNAKTGKIPMPLRIGNRDLWPLETLEAWEVGKAETVERS